MANRRNNRFQKVREFIARQAMLENAGGVVLAVSGGADSVVLLDIFVRLRELFARQKSAKELRLHVAHLNHLLRGRQSDEDAEFVRQLCESLALEATIQAVDVQALAKGSGKGLEETARQSRYKFLLEVANRQGYRRLATGHTMSDQAETFVMRLARGAGLRGLAAMRPVSVVPTFDGREGRVQGEEAENTSSPLHLFTPSSPPSFIPSSLHPFTPSSLHPLTASDSTLLIRPLLCITREEVEAYCAERGLQFRSDASNESLAYTRNRVRHKTLAALRELNPQVIERLAQTAENIAVEQDALEYLACEFLDRAEIAADGWENQRNQISDRKAYAIEGLLSQPTGLRRRMIIEAIRRIRERARRNLGQSSEIVSAHIEAVEKLLTDGVSGQRIMLPDGLQVWREFQALVLFFSTATASGEGETPAAQAYLYEHWLSAEQTSAEVAGLRITLVRKQPATRLREVLEEAREAKARSGIDWKIAALDDAVLPERLCLRPRRKGETARVCGQRKNNKLKKLMIDHRIASSRRETWPLLVTPDGAYVWSPGLPPALKFAASERTQTLAIVRASDV